MTPSPNQMKETGLPVRHKRLRQETSNFCLKSPMMAEVQLGQMEEQGRHRVLGTFLKVHKCVKFVTSLETSLQKENSYAFFIRTVTRQTKGDFVSNKLKISSTQKFLSKPLNLEAVVNQIQKLKCKPLKTRACKKSLPLKRCAKVDF